MNKKRRNEFIQIVVSIILFLTLALVISIFLDKKFVPLIENLSNETKRLLGILAMSIGFLFIYLFFRAARFYYYAKEKRLKLTMMTFLAALGATLFIQVGSKFLIF
jgi:uncharacterized BrkB/YihY/UPF0761 family membrane protein